MTGGAASTAMNNFSTCWLVVNAASGSNSEGATARLNDSLAAVGIVVARRISVPDENLPTVTDLNAANVDLLVVYTSTLR